MASALDSVRQVWEETDYVLRGEFCPPEELGPILDQIRTTTGAKGALLLVAGPRGLLQSLSAYSAADAAGPAVTALLREGRGIRLRYLLRPPNQEPRRTTYPNSAGRLVKLVLERAASVDGLAGALCPSEEWVPVRVPAALGGTRLAIAVILCRPNPTCARLLIEDGVEVVDCDELVLQLAIRANATANARVHHDAITMSRVDEKLGPDLVRSGRLDLAVAAQRLVELAAEVAGSDLAVYYAADPVRRRLHLRAWHPPDPAPLGVAFPEHLDMNDTNTVAASADRRRPVLLDPENEPQVRGAFVAADVSVLNEMATPVPGPLAGAEAPVAGVMAVARVGQSGELPRPFGDYDRALLRNVALRLALLRSTADLEATSEMFNRLTVSRTSNEGSAGVEADVPGIAISSEQLPVPDDLAAALPAIRLGLETIADLTGSHSATFRAALPDPTTPGMPGFALYRLAAHPPERLQDSKAVQPLADERGVNCDVALSGSPRVVSFVGDEEDVELVRQGTLSEISVPVVVEGLLVGVVNLESPAEQNYDSRVATALAFAEHVGLVIANKRLALGRVLQEYAIEIITRGHDLSGECFEITRAIEHADETVRRDVGKQLSVIDARARGLRVFDVTEPVGPVAAMPELARTAWEAADLHFVDETIDDLPWRRYARKSAGILSECLRHVFANVQDHLPLTAPSPQVHVTQVEWGGQRYDVVRIVNYADRSLTREAARNLYRVPITRPQADLGDPDAPPRETPRFGAYLAGNHARVLSGDVSLTLQPDGRARVTVMIPCPPPLEAACEHI